jgi:hypothetical protein
MSWWTWIVVAWAALGCALIALVEYLARNSTSRDGGPLSQETVFLSVVMSVVLMIAAPLLVLYGIGSGTMILWKGRLPVSGRIWWPARARKYEIAEEDWPDRDKALLRMVALRHEVDSRISRKEPPGEWPMFEVWETPEGMILETIELHADLKDAGLTDHLIFEKIETLNSRAMDADLPGELTLRSYLERRLMVDDPEYLTLVPSMLDKIIYEARDFVDRRRTYDATRPLYPPLAWLVAPTSVAAVERGEGLFGSALGATPAGYRRGLSRTDSAWHAIKSRMIAGDELWTYSSGIEQGVVLMRSGQPVRSVITGRGTPE